MDDCGACFGSNLAKDDCSVCHGNNTLCAGCDGLPNSGLELDPCGLCVPAGTSLCARARIKSETKMVTPMVAAAMGSSLVILCLLVLAVLLYLYRARKSATVAAHQAELTKAAPTGNVFIVTTDIESSTMLWETDPAAMIDVLETHNAIMRDTMAATGGYEFKTEGDAFFVAYTNVEDVIAFCVYVQDALMATAWPAWLNEALPTGDPSVWNGVRVRMGVHVGPASHTFDERAARMLYFGRVVKLATLVTDSGAGGQIMVSRPVVDALAASRQPSAKRSPRDGPKSPRVDVILTPIARLSFDGIHETCEVWELLPLELAGRTSALTERRLYKNAEAVELLDPEADQGLAEAMPRGIRAGTPIGMRAAVAAAAAVSADGEQGVANATTPQTTAIPLTYSIHDSAKTSVALVARLTEAAAQRRSPDRTFPVARSSSRSRTRNTLARSRTQGRTMTKIRSVTAFRSRGSGLNNSVSNVLDLERDRSNSVSRAESTRSNPDLESGESRSAMSVKDRVASIRERMAVRRSVSISHTRRTSGSRIRRLSQRSLTQAASDALWASPTSHECSHSSVLSETARSIGDTSVQGVELGDLLSEDGSSMMS
ncbi:adenylate and Guanylate cyclase catalytic domain-containing protein [Thecamonas trahens ATCC 50062]|uniref:Adenylate and Guanylate cyclase catalytic domain-containing protein n=1 Tax=Thecamonas trahens ATCC 50062 TaxID=461836 RepID=A0A0L0DGK4_THETB|nr:adenylate and Guanylate cyclase catalytic domain-containing protein [Thecamonas trahens ATCC 50062]KNC51320.1 adenylate and Guanylate cyclase catalytic domain-containing protein [Thecamonas trahens ATCC 50062]|eukprot:XP_013756242.1 adenylate and Guanylate cyclase catalytic domain-containing protein [Thecamonas trahens ATCC 50062]